MFEKKRSLWEFFIRNRKFTYMLIVAIILIGIISIIQIPKESNPDVDFPVFVVMTPFPGAGAEDVEELITNPLEDKIIGISEIDEISSSSSRGLSSITVFFDVDSESSEKQDQLREKIDEVKPDLPDDAQDPRLVKIRMNDFAVLSYVLSGPYNVAHLQSIAEDLADEIERVSGVSTVQISGGENREIQVMVNKAKLDEFGLALGQITQAIATANTDIPAGSIETAGSKYSLRFEGKLKTAAGVENTPIIQRSGSPILIRDVAEVIDGYTEKSSLSQYSKDGSMPRQAISLKVFKLTGGDTVQIVDNIHLKVESVRDKIIPEGAEFEVIEDNARFIREDITDLSKSGLQTVIIVMIILFFSVGF